MTALIRANLIPILLATLSFAPQIAHCAEAEMSLTERAHVEIEQAGKSSVKSTPVEIGQTMLTLKDPRPEIRGRSWDYSLQLGLQEFQPRGIISNERTNSQFNLNENGGTVLPSIEFGLRSNLIDQAKWNAKWNLGGFFAYTSQKASAKFDTGFEVPNVRLNTMLLGVNPTISLNFARLHRLHFNLGAEWGKVSYTQVSTNEYAAVRQAAQYSGATAGLEYTLNPTWSLTSRYARRNINEKNSTIQIQPNNIEVGTRILW